jgi:hypothetical protein
LFAWSFLLIVCGIFEIEITYRWKFKMVEVIPGLAVSLCMVASLVSSHFLPCKIQDKQNLDADQLSKIPATNFMCRSLAG